MIHAGIHTRSKINIHYTDSENIENMGSTAWQGMDAILVPGGFGKRGVEGKIMAIRYARENRIPYLGICLGMQLAVIEYARDKAGMEGAHSTEFNPDDAVSRHCPDYRMAYPRGSTGIRNAESDLGGSMRLGGQECLLKEGFTCPQNLWRRQNHRAPPPSL